MPTYVYIRREVGRMGGPDVIENYLVEGDKNKGHGLPSANVTKGLEVTIWDNVAHGGPGGPIVSYAAIKGANRALYVSRGGVGTPSEGRMSEIGVGNVSAKLLEADSREAALVELLAVGKLSIIMAE